MDEVITSQVLILLLTANFRVVVSDAIRQIIGLRGQANIEIN